MGFSAPMRSREIAVNTLLGILLVSVFLLPFLFLAGILEYAVSFSTQLLRIIPPTLRSESAVFGALLCFLCLINGITGIRKQNWRSAFLFFTFIPMIFSMWYAHSLLTIDGVFFRWFMFFVVLEQIDPSGLSKLPANRSRFDFFTGTSIAGTIIAINTGLLGSGEVSHVASVCVLSATVIVFFRIVRLAIANRIFSSDVSAASSASS
jgi:hypothetical protein